MARLFLALWPDDEVVDELRLLPRKDSRGVRFVPPERWHVTLRFFGEASPDPVIGAMDGVELPAVVARYGPGVDVLGGRTLIVPAGGLETIEAIVRARTARLGEPSPSRPFRGHLTVARLKPHATMPPALGLPLSVTQDVTEVALVESRLHPDGPEYTTLATWPVG